MHSLPDHYPEYHTRLNIPEVQVRTAVKTFDDNKDDFADDERLSQWVDDLYYEAKMEYTTNSYVIDLEEGEPWLPDTPPGVVEYS